MGQAKNRGTYEERKAQAVLLAEKDRRMLLAHLQQQARQGHDEVSAGNEPAAASRRSSRGVLHLSFA